MSKSILILPDAQVKAGIDMSYLKWIGQYILDKKPDIVVNIGDFADMPSLSSYDKGTKSAENRRYQVDIDAAIEGMKILQAPCIEYNKSVDARNKIQKRDKKKLFKKYLPRMVLTLGNHEDRITRAVEQDATFEGKLSLKDLKYEEFGWEVIPFLKPIEIEGIMFCHYFYNPFSGKPFGGTVENILKQLGKPFVQGHKQGLHVGTLAGRNHWGIIAGSSYMHDEAYKGYQGNDHWRGIVLLNNVHNGSHDPIFISLDYLEKRYAGKD